MDVLLVHYQPGNLSTSLHPAVVTTLAGLSHNQPQETVPFIKGTRCLVLAVC